MSLVTLTEDNKSRLYRLWQDTFDTHMLTFKEFSKKEYLEYKNLLESVNEAAMSYYEWVQEAL